MADIASMLGGLLGRSVAPQPRPTPIPSQIGTAIGSIFGGQPVQPKPMPMPNIAGAIGGMAAPKPVASSLGGGAPGSVRAAWFAAHPNPRRFARKGY